MYATRTLRRPLTVLLPVLYLLFVHVFPASGQKPDQADIRIQLGEDGRRMIGETEKNLVDVLSAATIHASDGESLTVVLFIAHLSKGKLIAKGESPPFRMNTGTAPSRGGVRLGQVLPREQLRAVAPLRPAEFVVTGSSLATSWLNAAEAVADPGAAFRKVEAEALFVAVVPADAAARERTRTRPLLLEIVVP